MTDWVPRRLMITCTWRVLFQLEARSWLIDNFNGRWHAQPIKGQFLREYGSWMICSIPSGWIEQYHTWGQGQAWWTMQAVIVEDSPGWALHLQLSGWLAHEWANASKEQRKLWDTNKGTLWRWSIEGGDLYFKSGKDACISSNLQKKTPFAHIFQLLQENPKEMKRSTLQSGSREFSTLAVRKHQVFQPFFCHPLRTSPGKSYFSHLSYHIFSIWVGRPS